MASAMHRAPEAEGSRFSKCAFLTCLFGLQIWLQMSTHIWRPSWTDSWQRTNLRLPAASCQLHTAESTTRWVASACAAGERPQI
eukprot:scaffold59830_cov17-Tisochrysis_lutea.AAC.1